MTLTHVKLKIKSYTPILVGLLHLKCKFFKLDFINFVCIKTKFKFADSLKPN